MFLETLRSLCLAQPERVAIEFIDDPAKPPQIVRYGELETMVLRTAAMLRQKGVHPGDRVAIQLTQRLPFIYLHLAAMRVGAVSLPLNPAYPLRELRYFLQDAEAKLFFTDALSQSAIQELTAQVPSLQEVIPLERGTANTAFERLITQHGERDAANLPLPDDPNATCLMIYTSGTTGWPKGAELTHRNLTANLNSLHEAWEWQNDDVLLHVLPLFHVHGLIVALHGALNAGATIVLLSRFEPLQTLELLVHRPCTVFMGVPTIHRRLVEAPGAERYSLRHMRLVTSGSDRLPDDLFHRFEKQFGIQLLERYGLSEAGMILSNPLRGERRVGSVGLPLPGVEVRIADPETDVPLPDGQIGEVQVYGDNVFKGYWRQPEKTAAVFTPDGWLRTGDLGLREPDGYFTLKGRAKDLIISGGYNVYPSEVERVLNEHPAVETSAVIGCPDPEWGERVIAIVELRSGAKAEPGEIMQFCRAHLAPYKAPKQVFFAATLPRNALGKVQKSALRNTYCQHST